MSTTAAIFDIHLLLGYAAWLPAFAVYAWPRLKAMDPVEAQRAIATLHSFRFFGLVFVVPGLVGAGLPAGFGPFAAYGDFATGILALLAVFAVGIRALFWPLVVAYNVVGTIDILVDYYHGVTLGLGAAAGELGSAYAIPIIYVPLLMITHAAAFILMMRKPARGTAAVTVS